MRRCEGRVRVRPTVNFIGLLAGTIAALSFQQSSRAQAPDQSVTIFQYRQVPPDKVAEFVHRETTYWTKVAQKAVDAKKMTLWVLNPTSTSIYRIVHVVAAK